MKAKDAATQMETPKFKKTMMKTFQFAEIHFKWNAMIRTNLLIYQKFTLGLFLNIAKGYRQDDKAVLKVSFVLSAFSLLIVYSNGYILYYIVEKYFNSNKKMLFALKEKRELLAQRQLENSSKKKKVVEHDTVDADDSVMELKPNSKISKSKDKRQVKITKKRKIHQIAPNGRKTNIVSNKNNSKSKANKAKVLKNKKNSKNTKPVTEVKPIEKKKTDKSDIFPDSLSIFNALQPYHFYSRHYYAIRYVLKPTIFSASVTILYSMPIITLMLMFAGFVIDFYLGLKNYIFKKPLNNKSIVVENGIFILVSLVFTIFVFNGDSSVNTKNLTMGYVVMGLIAAAFISLIVFKVKGKKAL